MRRFHIASIAVGKNELSSDEAHHARNVLRLPPGARVEVFDGNGASARGRIAYDGASVVVSVEKIDRDSPASFDVACATAAPKGERAEFMFEKLAELGISTVYPLMTERSVVHPGRTKIARFRRITEEACRQSGNNRIPIVAECTTLDALLAMETPARRIYASTTACRALIDIISGFDDISSIIYMIGPEGGWSAKEERRMNEQNWVPYSLGSSTLRIETAAIATLAVINQVTRRL